LPSHILLTTILYTADCNPISAGMKITVLIGHTIWTRHIVRHMMKCMMTYDEASGVTVDISWFANRIG